MVGHSNLGLADAIRRRKSSAGDLRYFGIRHEGGAAFACLRLCARLTGKPAACLIHRRTGRDQPADRPVGCQGRPRAGAGVDRPSADVQVFGPGAFQEIDLASAFESVAEFSVSPCSARQQARRVDVAWRARTHRRTSTVAAFDLPRRHADHCRRRRKTRRTGRAHSAANKITPATRHRRQGDAMTSIREHKRPIIVMPATAPKAAMR